MRTGVNWNDVRVAVWKLSGWSSGVGCFVDGKNENFVKKEVVFCFASFFISLHISWCGALTASLLWLNFRHLCTKRST